MLIRLDVQPKPLAQQENMLARVDRQLRDTVGSPGSATQNPLVMAVCYTPWDIARLFNLPSDDPTSLVDAYELRAVCLGVDYFEQDFAADAPGPDEWQVEFDYPRLLPLFSPLDVWKAIQRRNQGDPGDPPPLITCETDKLLRNIRRGYKAPMYCVPELATNAHDVHVLAAAMTGGGSLVNKLVRKRVLWETRTYIAGTALHDYGLSYSQTTLANLRTVLKLQSPGELRGFLAEWVSPTIIPLIESSEEFRDRTTSPKWLLYKAVTVQKGELPEEQHNLMMAKAVADDKYAKAYFEFLTPRS